MAAVANDLALASAALRRTGIRLMRDLDSALSSEDSSESSLAGSFGCLYLMTVTLDADDFGSIIPADVNLIFFIGSYANAGSFSQCSLLSWVIALFAHATCFMTNGGASLTCSSSSCTCWSLVLWA